MGLIRIRYFPVPVSATVCGEPLALSVAARFPVSAPVAVGLKEMETLHVAPEASDAVQVCAEIRNELALAPVKDKDVNVSVDFPVLVM
jgi:hypothetical protein